MVDAWFGRLQESSSSEPWVFAAVFFMGLFLNLTPCVYPMFFVTLSLFSGGKNAFEPRKRVLGKALTYVFGIATMYSVLGVSAAWSGTFFGAVLQNRWILASIGIILLMISLSMFGVYIFRLPSWLTNRIGGMRPAGFLGIYLSGLFVGIFAAPCIGPPVIALLAHVAERGDPFYGFCLFFVMSLGLGLPYLVLCFFSNAIRRFPKSGNWMLWFEHLFGAALVVLAFFYLLVAFQPGGLAWLPFLAFTGGGIGLGFFDRAGNSGNKFKWFKRSFGLLAVLIGLLFFPFHEAESVDWEPYTSRALDEAKAEREAVVLDFYADWCIPCHELEQFTYTDPEVIRELASFRKFKLDVTQYPGDPEIAEAVRRFEVSGVPAVLFLDPEGYEATDARISGFVDAEEFLAILHALPFRGGNRGEVPPTERI